VLKKITEDTEEAGRTVRASEDDPQYLVQSEKSGGRRSTSPGRSRRRTERGSRAGRGHPLINLTTACSISARLASSAGTPSAPPLTPAAVIERSAASTVRPSSKRCTTRGST
jgi:hypothetical protein